MPDPTAPALPQLQCPDCGQPCAIIYGCGWDNDFAFCACGFDRTLPNSTRVDYSE